MILVIDNYDSFAYNLVQYLGELGWEPVVYRNDAITVELIKAMAPSHIIISPGPCTPLEAGISNDVVRYFRGRIPILGVCLGHQCIGYVYGGLIKRVHLLLRKVNSTKPSDYIKKLICSGVKHIWPMMKETKYRMCCTLQRSMGI